MTPGTLFFLGEGPGVVESKTGRPFVEYAPAGAELSRYLNGLALPHRLEVYLTNLFKEWAGGAPTKGKEPTQADLDLSEWELHLELQTVKPRLVVALGRWAARWLVGPVTMEVSHGLLYHILYCPGCGKRWRSYEGLSQIVAVPGVAALCTCALAVPVQDFYVLPVVHPAAGLHNPVQAALTAYDMAQLAGLLKLPPVLWEGLAWKPGVKGVYQWGPKPWNQSLEAGLDTEGRPEAPWGWSTSFEPGTGEVYKHGGAWLPFPQHWMAKIRWVVHNYLWDSKVCQALGMPIPDDSFDDTQVMAYLLGVEPQALKDLGERHLGQVTPEFQDVVGEYHTVLGKTGKPLKKQKLVLKSLDEIDPQVACDYAGGDADMTRAIKPILWKRIEALGLEHIYEVDRRVLPLYSRMEQVGLPVNLEHYQTFSAWLTEEIAIKTFLLQTEYPELNPASPDQVAEIMYGHLGIPGGKKTPSGKRFTTNDKILQALKGAHPFVAAIVEWRELAKLKSTFVDKLPLYCHDGRLLFQLLPTRVVSGRVAYKNPNAGAFPKYTVLGHRFRAGIQAPPGRALGSWDLNQIELRVLAVDSGSQALQSVFLTGGDLHERTRTKIFGKVPDLTGAQRRAAKEVNFGIPMGITEIGLAEQMRKRQYPFPELEGKHLPTLEARREAEAKVCREWIAAVIADWNIEGYIKAKHAEARQFGYVRSLGGRIRFLPSVLSPNKQIREAAQRDAQAFGPQAGARYVMKTIESRVWREVIQPLNAEGPSRVAAGYPWNRVEPCLDIHDDLLLEFDEDLGPLLLVLIESMVAATFDLAVPVTCKGSVGKIWSEL